MSSWLLLLAAGCGGTDPEGVWRFELQGLPDGSQECSENASHNFEGASRPSEGEVDSPWTDTGGEELSVETFYGLVLAEGGSMVLVVRDRVYTGTLADDGTWSFAWRSYDRSDESQVHASGYGYTHSSDDTACTVLEGLFDGDGFAGSWQDSTDTLLSWTESDTWSDEVAAEVGTTGRIPAGSYLVVDDGAGGTRPASNAYDAADCAVSVCTLSVETSCLQTRQASAVRTDLDAEGFQAVQDADWPPGT